MALLFYTYNLNFASIFKVCIIYKCLLIYIYIFFSGINAGIYSQSVASKNKHHLSFCSSELYAATKFFLANKFFMLNCYFICYGTYNHLVKDDGCDELVCGIWFLTAIRSAMWCWRIIKNLSLSMQTICLWVPIIRKIIFGKFVLFW